MTLAEFEAIDPEPGKISNRSGLIHALTEAAELEHGLLLQYLFAAFSMRTRPQPGFTVQAELVRRWEASILKVARDEMGHLGTVCNLLTAIGGAPQFRRPQMPVPNRYFPQDPPAAPFRPFSLEPFSLATVERFVGFEAPPPKVSGFRAAISEPQLRYATIGDLYGQITEAFERLDRNSSLFIGPHSDQDTDTWSANLKLLKVTDVTSAAAAIKSIVEEGEGSDDPGQSSHWSRFREIHEQLQAEIAADPTFRPARPVLSNPMTRAPACPGAPVVDDPYTRQVSELFNWVYATMLLMLLQHYSYAGDTEAQRTFLRATIRRLMSGVIRPLGEILTELPAHEGSPEPTAGPSFELYADLRLPARRDSAWTLFRERLTEAAAACAALGADARAPARLATVHEHLALAARSVIHEA